MSFNLQHARPLLQACNLPKLFVEELGWEPCRKTVTLRVLEKDYIFKALAEKRGFTAWLCESPDGGLPDHATRLKLDRKLSETSFEHLIVFVTQDRSRQSWVWVRRETGKPLAARTHDYRRDQPGDSLLQKLQALYVSLAEEEAGEVSTVVVAARARAAFDIERVTKSFYRDFDPHRKAFLDFIKGIDVEADCKWYVSVMLNRLMFIYFIQRKGFLDGDRAYLRNRLERCKRERGADKFYTFYRYFLLHLFHEGLGKKPSERPKDLEALLGRIPYLNGGLFEVHELERPERYGNTIQIPDQAFEEIFDYFDRYQWHLDERPLKQDNEINPDVLGYIFEKFINQKQMGAYYTKEDITEYISKNTVIPFIFDSVRTKCKVAFEGESSVVWSLLKDNPDRYIYAAVRHGTDKPLPYEIAIGLDTSVPGLLERRKAWNKAAPAEYALPTEIWREVVARRQRYEELRQKIVAGEIREINDLITYNLDMRQFAQDVILNCEGPDLLDAFWQAISTITILDPTGGSGAFVFAALNILDPLYEACLDRMEAFLAEWGESGRKTHPNYYKRFTEVLERVDAPPNRRYFILKSIILKNLYAVDIMEEAVEICKLRLFLKLAAQVEPDASRDNLGIQPLPDIDFNIRSGNTLVGYATKTELESVGNSDLILKEQVKEVIEAAEDAAKLYECFQKCQVDGDQSPAEFKIKLHKKFDHAREKCDRFIAESYELGISKDEIKFDKWKKTHQPFHWFLQFYGIMNDGGFDVIIGNPPYVELNVLKDYKIRDYACNDSGNLYALVMERCELLGQDKVRQGYIVPVSSVSTERYETLQNLLINRENFYSSYDDRPSRLFEELEHIRLTIHIIGNRVDHPKLCSTRYHKWMSEERSNLFDKLTFANTQPTLVRGTFPKLCSEVEEEIIRKLVAQQQSLCLSYTSGTENVIFYSRKVGYFLQVLDFEPSVLDGKGNRRPPSEFKDLRFSTHDYAKLGLCCLNSNLFYWFVTVFSDCRHVNKREVDAFPINLLALSASQLSSKLVGLGGKLMDDLQKHSEKRTMRFKHDTLTVQCICPKASKPLIDEIDKLLAQHYGFTEEELDFIINYDIKYRMGRDAESVE